MYINNLYYLIKPFIPRQLQLIVRRRVALNKKKRYQDIWPIDREATKLPLEWSGWPNNKQFALILTHDVEAQKGLERCHKLIELEKTHGFRSSFNFVAEGYSDSSDMRNYLAENGFEVGLHGINHNPRNFLTKNKFQGQVKNINYYLKKWGAVGYRSPCMFHNLEWFHQLNIEYDASTFDTDPFEPQPDGVRTIFPFWVNYNSSNRGYVELPYTLPQDFTLFMIFQEKNIQIWKRKLDWIAEQGGMALLNTHPDYMNFGNKEITFQEYPAGYYEDFLKYIITNYQGKYWNPLPREMACFWKKGMEKTMERQFENGKSLCVRLATQV